TTRHSRSAPCDLTSSLLSTMPTRNPPFVLKEFLRTCLCTHTWSSAFDPTILWFQFKEIKRETANFGSANGNRTRISALKGPRANRCTIAPRVFRFSEFNVLPHFYQSPHEVSPPAISRNTAKELCAVQIFPYSIYGILPMAAKGQSR